MRVASVAEHTGLLALGLSAARKEMRGRLLCLMKGKWKCGRSWHCVNKGEVAVKVVGRVVKFSHQGVLYAALTMAVRVGQVEVINTLAVIL